MERGALQTERLSFLLRGLNSHKNGLARLKLLVRQEELFAVYAANSFQRRFDNPRREVYEKCGYSS